MQVATPLWSYVWGPCNKKGLDIFVRESLGPRRVGETGLTRAELQDLASLRLEEAEALFSAGKFDGCVYLCGYVVELALKAIVCRTLAVDEYPETKAFKVHDFDTLVLFAGLHNTVDGLSGELKTNWSLITKWESTVRYALRNTYDESAAQNWLIALRDPVAGVLIWLQTKW